MKKFGLGENLVLIQREKSYDRYIQHTCALSQSEEMGGPSSELLCRFVSQRTEM